MDTRNKETRGDKEEEESNHDGTKATNVVESEAERIVSKTM